MNDLRFQFKGRKYPRKYAHIVIHYSKSDERIKINIIDKKRTTSKPTKCDSSRLDKIYIDMISYFRNHNEIEELK